MNYRKTTFPPRDIYAHFMLFYIHEFKRVTIGLISSKLIGVRLQIKIYVTKDDNMKKS